VAATPWDESLGRCASTSSYGMSGTNAYAVLSPAPRADPAADVPKPSGFLVSAATRPALVELAHRYATHLSALPDADYPAFACTANGGRARLKHAVWVQADGAASAAAALAALASGTAHQAVRTLTPDESVPEAPHRAVAALPPYPWQRSTYIAVASG
jgi:acyl transferase domain-containing protein